MSKAEEPELMVAGSWGGEKGKLGKDRDGRRLEGRSVGRASDRMVMFM